MIAMIRKLLLSAVSVALAWSPAAAQQRPNIVLLYTDDLGYGDVSSYGAAALTTPSIDRLARDGLRFTDAHAAAATCTPSRYALLTGQYAFRKPGTGVLPGNAALIIEPGRTTLPSLLQQAGYTTAVVGKWHLGLGPKGGPDWNGDVRPGPNDIGFDYSFIMAATGDRVPTVYVENRRVVGLTAADPIAVSYAGPVGDWPTGTSHPELLKVHPSHGHDQTIVNGISRIGYMTGGKAALWKDEDMADVFTARAIDFIERQKDKPFFLYFATHDPHVPRVPHPRFAGRTGMGPRGDAIVEADWCVGEILAALDRLKLANDTLVIFTSDNGPVIDDGYKDDAVAKLGTHKPAGPFRGGKYSNFEAGTRVPFIVRWPGRVKRGVSGALLTQVDLLASLASFTGRPLAPDDGPDSHDVMSTLLGTSAAGRSEIVEQAGGLALRQGAWKYIEPSDRPKVNQNTNTELGNDPAPQLYNLASDPGEARNVAADNPGRVKAMAARLREIRQAGRSRAIPAQPPIPSKVTVPIEYHTLDNGLKVVLSRDTSSPTAVVAVYYGIGFRVEPKDRTGFAHLFEHMMFQGSEHLGKNEFISLVESNGGILNGSTRFDFTNYFQVVPAHTVETILWAEADRMRGLKIVQDNLTNQQGVVKNEVKVNVLNQPYGGFPWLEMPQAANTNWYNAHNFYGDLEDLDAATLRDVQQFFKTYYAPNNAVVVVSGDIDPKQTLQWVRRYFGGIARSKLPPHPDVSEPRQDKERRITRQDPLANRPALGLGYHAPPRETPEYYAMGLIDQLLVQGADSRLYQALVQTRGLTGSVSGGINPLLGNMFDIKGPTLWMVWLIHDADRKADDVIQAIDEEIARLQTTPVTKDELDLALVKRRSRLYADYEQFIGFGRANLLASYALFDDDPGKINQLEDEFRKVTPELIQSTAKEYLRSTNRTILTIAPKGKGN
jgi:arylsulfatase A-like enzyme/predicted Zn-dependent peptidase